MRSVFVVVADVLVHQPLQMPYVQNDDRIQQISSAIPHPAFGDAVLPRASEVGLLGNDAEALHRADDLLTEVRSAIEDQIIRRCIVRKCFTQLLRNPQATWMPGDVAVENPAPVVCNDEEAVQDTKGQRRNGKEIRRCNRFSVVVQESRPTLRQLRTPRSLPHPTRHRSLRYVEAEHSQFSMNTRRAPGQVLSYHAEDEFAHLFAYTLSSLASAMPREPLPIQLESSVMPTNNGLRLDKDQRLLPFRPKST
jgi:hypothetical protein